MSAAVSLRHVSRGFQTGGIGAIFRPSRRGSFQVLRDLTLDISTGERLALIGSNGAGKTTLLKILAGLLHPDHGDARVLGMDVRTDGTRVRRAVGYVLADERSFFWRLSVRHNMEFFAALSGLTGAERDKRIATLLEGVGLEGKASANFSDLSTGMKQRLAIARALIGQPRLLLMDEPTRSLDGEQTQRVWDLVHREITDEGGTLLLVTHHLEEALAQCSHVAVLREGRVGAHMSVEEARQLISADQGVTLSVRQLQPGVLDQVRAIPGVQEVHVVSQLPGETQIEVWSEHDEPPVGPIVATLTAAGVSLTSLRQGQPVGALLARLSEVADAPVRTRPALTSPLRAVG